uniref:Gustatory receptor n=1 Tax=Musca domestica TaxID=7370 RepID=A0A1I8M8M4_MUSDO
METLGSIVRAALMFLILICGLYPITRFPWVTLLLRIGLLVWLFVNVFLMFYLRMNGRDTSIGGLVGTASFVCNGITNIIIILESMLHDNHAKIMHQLEDEIFYIFKRHFHKRIEELEKLRHKMSKEILAIFCIELICIGFKLWINAISSIQPVFWQAFPTSVSLRVRYIQIIAIVIKFNGHGEIFKHYLKLSTTDKTPSNAVGLWQPYKDEEYAQLNARRLIYLRIWEMFKSLNDAFGWSILYLFITSFFDIVCNCYWTFTAGYKGQVFHKYVFNGATSISLSSLVITLFYYTDTSYKNSRYIGCLISKLVKQPLGNKRYNDLVSEFSVQTLHQRFIVTAKEFFALNLGLLGSMVAAIVTYLVILIQFMFTEKSNGDSKISSSKLETTTIANTLLFTTSAVNSTILDMFENNN